MNAAERRQAIRERTQKNYDKKDQGAYIPGKNVLNFDIIGGYKQEMLYKPEISEAGKKDIINRIDILPFIVTTNNLRELSPGTITYNAEVFVHRKLGPGEKDTYLCAETMYNDSCPVCEEKRMLKEQNVPNEKLKGNPLGIKQRCFYNVVDLNAPREKRKVQIFEEIHYWFERLLLDQTAFGNGQFMEFWDPEFGHAVEFVVRSKKTSEGTNLDYTIRYAERVDPKKYSDKIIEQTYPLDKMIIKPSYEEVRNAFYQIGSGEVEEPGNDDKFAPGMPGISSSGDSFSAQTNIPVRDVNDDLQRPPFNEVDPHIENSITDTQSESRQIAEPAQSTTRRFARRISRAQEPEIKCPYNYVLGKDNGYHQECSTCDEEIFQKCEEERLKLQGK